MMTANILTDIQAKTICKLMAGNPQQLLSWSSQQNFPVPVGAMCMLPKHLNQIEGGEWVFVSSDEGMPLIIVCLRQEYRETYEALLDDLVQKKFDLHPFSYQQSTLLHWVLGFQFFDMDQGDYTWVNQMAERLLQVGLSPKDLDHSVSPPRTVMEWAIRRGNTQGLALCLRHLTNEDFGQLQGQLNKAITQLWDDREEKNELGEYPIRQALERTLLTREIAILAEQAQVANVKTSRPRF